MLKAGITGSIGAGKTTVCRLFELLGIPVFYADDAAKMLMDTDPRLIAAIRQLLGEEVYDSGRLDRSRVSALVFSNPEKLAALNALVHPAAIAYAAAWMDRQQAPYTLKEAAVFFESGSHKAMDIMIGVDAPEELRIARVLRRSGLTRNDVLLRMAKQMDNTEKMRRCDFVLVNDDQQALLPQVLSLHGQLLDKAREHSLRPAEGI